MIILGSGSPRRKELLAQIGMEFQVIIPQVEELTPEDITEPAQLVMANSALKAQAIAKDNPEDLVVTADTVVALEGKIFGKPKDEAEAIKMLQALAGRKHDVYTGVTMVKKGKCFTEVAKTEVEMMPLTMSEIQAYVATGDPLDKAGAYGIQGYAAKFIKGINGCYFNVVGLPLALFYAMYKKVDEINDNNQSTGLTSR